LERRRPSADGGHLLPGVCAASAIALIATLLGGQVPVVGAPVIAVALGLTVSMVLPRRVATRSGLSFTARHVLRAAIVILGFGLSLRQVGTIGVESLPVLLGTLIAALVTAWVAGRLLRMSGDLTTLIGVGTAICGASAIAATSSVIDADDADVSYAIATIFTFNVIAVLAYPTIGHALGLSQHSFGLWAGTAINDVSSVVAASTVYGHAAGTYGVVVKLTRTLAIIPICLGLAAWRGRGPSRSSSAEPTTISSIFPTFIIAFVVAVVLNTVGLIPAQSHRVFHDLAAWMITAALAAVGLSADVKHIARSGLRPLALGALLWFTVGTMSLVLQALTGKL
jgi:uncharacterized integral membrane protein (TIGR00698 family)